jgi:hypothetical protein
LNLTETEDEIIREIIDNHKGDFKQGDQSGNLTRLRLAIDSDFDAIRRELIEHGQKTDDVDYKKEQILCLLLDPGRYYGDIINNLLSSNTQTEIRK